LHDIQYWKILFISAPPPPLFYFEKFTWMAFEKTMSYRKFLPILARGVKKINFTIGKSHSTLTWVAGVVCKMFDHWLNWVWTVTVTLGFHCRESTDWSTCFVLVFVGLVNFFFYQNAMIVTLWKISLYQSYCIYKSVYHNKIPAIIVCFVKVIARANVNVHQIFAKTKF
jgi:hypothetical protein